MRIKALSVLSVGWERMRVQVGRGDHYFPALQLLAAEVQHVLFRANCRTVVFKWALALGSLFMALLLSPQELRAFFVTFVTAERRSIFQVDRNAGLLVDVLCGDREKRRYCLHAWVVMPDHVHLLLTPAEDVPLKRAIQFIKGGYSFRLKSGREVWQRGYLEHRIQDAADFERHAEYIAQNPVRAGLGDNYAWSHVMHPELVDPRPGHFEGRAQG